MDKKNERRGLGRGLSALMADVNIDADPVAADRPRRPDMLVPVEKLVPNPDQPRRDFLIGVTSGDQAQHFQFAFREFWL